MSKLIKNFLVHDASKIFYNDLKNAYFFNFSDVAADPEGEKSSMAPNATKKPFQIKPNVF